MVNKNQWEKAAWPPYIFPVFFETKSTLLESRKLTSGQFLSQMNLFFTASIYFFKTQHPLTASSLLLLLLISRIFFLSSDFLNK